MFTFFAKKYTDAFGLSYYTTSENGENAVRIYGIIIRKCINDKVVEEQNSGFITEDENKALKIIEILAENTVTPYALSETLDDMDIWE